MRLAAILALIAAAVFLVVSPGAKHEAALCPGCNVILISMDTLRADHLGAYGYSRPTSPNIDALAARGVLFENAISQSSWTRPSHTSMFTGLYPAEHGVVSMSGHKKFPPGVPTLASVLSRNGYATAAFTGGAHMSRKFGFDRGFDIYRTHGRRFEDNLEPARKWLEANRDRPFFMFFHGFDSHKPYKSEPVDRRALDLPAQALRGIAEICKGGGGRSDLRPYLGEYDAAIHRGDRSLGRLFAALDDMGLHDNTLIVFVSDHGEEFLEHGRCFHIRTLYREVLHVPLIIAVPGATPRRVSSTVAASASIPSTILDILGAGRGRLPGLSLAAALSGGELPAQSVVSETATRGDGAKGLGHLRSLTGDYEKLIDWITLNRREYFDLRNDPGEQHPMVQSAQGGRLLAQLDSWLDEHLSIHNEETLADLPPSLSKQLSALGYMEWMDE